MKSTRHSEAWRVAFSTGNDFGIREEVDDQIFWLTLGFRRKEGLLVDVISSGAYGGLSTQRTFDMRRQHGLAGKENTNCERF